MYRILLSDKSNKHLEKLKNKDKRNFEIIIKHLDNLKENPQFYGKPLEGILSGLWSCRAGDFRIIYQIRENVLVVFIMDIGHRKSIYDR